MTCIRKNLSGWSDVMRPTQRTPRGLAAAGSDASNLPPLSPPADLLLGHHALDLFGLALNPVARASVRLDWQARGNRIDVVLLRDIALLWSLPPQQHAVIDGVVDRAGPKSPEPPRSTRSGQANCLIASERAKSCASAQASTSAVIPSDISTALTAADPRSDGGSGGLSSSCWSRSSFKSADRRTDI
jgi:hypothetical protein